VDQANLIRSWHELRRQIIISQLAPTFLLIVTVGMLAVGLPNASLWVKLAALGILLASGILGALVQYSAATEAQAVARELDTAAEKGPLVEGIVSSARFLFVVRFVTPTIFVLIFLVIALALTGIGLGPQYMYHRW
jgi:hypothetical protein